MREHLGIPESVDDDAEPQDRDPDLTNTLMRLCMLLVRQDTS